jgi:subtilisin family serine protease
VNKFFISFSAFTFLIIATTISYSPIFQRSSLLDIPNAMAELEKEQDRHDPFLLATPSLTSSPTPPLSDSLPFGTITGSEIRQQPQEQELQSLSNSHNNKNPSMQSNLVGMQAATATTENIPNQYIVVLKPGTVSAQSESMAAEAKIAGANIIHTYENTIKGYTIRVPNQSALAAIQSDPRVDFVEQDQKMTIFQQALPAGVDRVDGDRSSAISGNGIGAVDADIAIIDSGIDLTHPDLNVYRDVSFVYGANSGNDDNGHGTHVAGIAAAKDNLQGVVGIAPGARLWAVKVMDSTGSGLTSTIIAGIDYVTQHANEIDVANLSFGCKCHSNALDLAIHNSVAAGITYVVSAGNSASDASAFSPSNHPDVISVSAIADSDGKCGGLGPSTKYGNDDTFASFSNYGSAVDMAAPGVNIYSTYKGGTYATLSGTSMASPHVTGAAALYKSSNLGVSPSEVKQALIGMGSSPSTVCDGNGHGYFSGDPDNIHEPLLYVR